MLTKKIIIKYKQHGQVSIEQIKPSSSFFTTLENKDFIIKKMFDNFQARRYKGSRFVLDQSDDQQSYSEPVQPKLAKNTHHNFQALYDSRSRFIQFASTLGPLKQTQIREDILNHCEQNSKKQKIYETFMSDETILKIINLRIDKMIKNKRIKKNWSQEDVQILIWVVSKYADKKRFADIEKDIDAEDWRLIATLIPGVTGQSCMFKWLSLKKVNLATNNWSQQESSLLSSLVNDKNYQGKGKDTKDWKRISQRLYFINNQKDKIFRNAKQCRQHWNCYLNPNLKKGPWKSQEDIQLLRCIKQNKGSKKWSQIVKYFDGRTENALKNRYTLIIDKQKKHNKHKNELEIIEEYLIKCYVDQFTVQIQHCSIEYNSNDDNYNEILNSKSQEKPPSQSIKIQELYSHHSYSINAPITPITPVKIERFFGLKQFLSKERFDFSSIQLGTLNNGIFEKSSIQTEQSYTASNEKIKLRKMHSSTF